MPTLTEPSTASLRALYHYRPDKTAEKVHEILKLQDKLADTQQRLEQANRRILDLTLQLHQAMHQEETTHAALHDWKCEAGAYYNALEMIPHIIRRQLAKGQSSTAIIAQLEEFCARHTTGKTHGPKSQPAAKDPSQN